MKPTIKILSLLAAVALTACEPKNEPVVNTTTDHITINAHIQGQSKLNAPSKRRVQTDGMQSAFETGDQIQVYGWTGDKTTVPANPPIQAINTLTIENQVETWTAAPQMLWQSQTAAHYFIGIYPVREVTNFSADAYLLNETKPQDADLLVAVSDDQGIVANNRGVDLTFKHMMAKININMNFRNQWENTPTPTVVKLYCGKEASVNYLLQAVTADDYVFDATKYIAMPALPTPVTGFDKSYTSIVVPQKGVNMVDIVIEGITYRYEGVEDLPFESGKVTTLNLNVGKDEITLAGITVGDWHDGETVGGGEAEEITTGTAMVALVWEEPDKADEINSLNTWAYDSLNALVYENEYPAIEDMEQDSLALPAGRYTIVVAANVSEPIEESHQATANALIYELARQSSLYEMSTYGDTTVNISVASHTNITVRMHSSTASENAYVDLGLPTGTLWAAYNVGATTPEETGDYYAWGETTPMQSPYGWAVYKWGSADNQLTKYCNDATYGKNGFVDNLLALEIADDAARAQWRKEWLMPTEAQINELRDECTWEHYTLNGVKGYRGTGENGNTIFFPLTTYYKEDGQSGNSDRSYYWSATLDDYYTPCAQSLMFSSVSVNILNSSITRSYACPIRPVYVK